jgi:hypothetical protein
VCDRRPDFTNGSVPRLEGQESPRHSPTRCPQCNESLQVQSQNLMQSLSAKDLRLLGALEDGLSRVTSTILCKKYEGDTRRKSPNPLGQGRRDQGLSPQLDGFEIAERPAVKQDSISSEPAPFVFPEAWAARSNEEIWLVKDTSYSPGGAPAKTRNIYLRQSHRLRPSRRQVALRVQPKR